MNLSASKHTQTHAMRKQWFIALNRFGLGAKLEQIKSVAGKPEDWLLQQLEKPEFNFDTSLPSSSEFIERNTKFKDIKKPQQRGELRRSFFADHNQYVVSRLQHEIATSKGFDLRVLNFFSNHFSVSKGNHLDTALAPTLEREAIAPNLFGKFEDMLLAVTKHPAMLRYLDNQNSFGPNSKIGLKKNKGLNENLAREILELHTMGVDGGYSQQDVEALARGITGWSISNPNGQTEAGFRYKTWGHEPGKFTLLGKTFDDNELQQGEAMLRFIAKHKSTASYICTKLATHFAGTNVDKSLIEKLTNTWHKSNGCLRQVFTCLITSEEAWQVGNRQYKQPRDFVVSVLRALPPALHPDNNEVRKLLINLGQGPFMAGSPAGFEQDENFWNTPTALINRIDWVHQLVNNYRGMPQPILNSQNLAQLSKSEHAKVMGAETKYKALLFFFVSPSFLRR